MGKKGDRDVLRLMLLSLIPSLPVAGVLTFLACYFKPEWWVGIMTVGVAMFGAVLLIEYKLISLPNERSVTKWLMG